MTMELTMETNQETNKKNSMVLSKIGRQTLSQVICTGEVGGKLHSQSK